MFRAVPCSSSGGQIVLLQPLVSYSMPVENGLSLLSSGILYDTRSCNNKICPPEDEQGTARNMLRIIV